MQLHTYAVTAFGHIAGTVIKEKQTFWDHPTILYLNPTDPYPHLGSFLEIVCLKPCANIHAGLKQKFEEDKIFEISFLSF